MTPFTDAKMKDFFATLPQNVQQSVLQSPPPTSLSELRTLAAKFSDLRHSSNEK